MKHLFSFRQRPNETLTHSTTRGLNGSRMVVETTVKGRSNDSRPTLGRLSTLFLLLFALSFGFNQEAKAATERYIYCGISNQYQTYKDPNDWGFNFWGGTTSGGVKSPEWIQDNYNWDNRNYTIYRVKVGDDNNMAQFKGNNSWWVPGSGKSVTLNGTTNNAVFFSAQEDGWLGQFQQNYQVSSTGSLTPSSSTTTTGTQVTLTPALTSNTNYNDIKSTTYSVTTNPGSAGSVSNGKFSATKAGTYVVKATITYNAKGFTGITKTVTATTTITVEDPLYTGLTIADNPSGYVTKASTLSANQVVQGQSVTITKGTPKTGYEFKDITVTSGGTISGTTWTPSANNQTATVNWKEKTHSVTISNDGNGSTSPSGAQTVGEVTGISITASPNDGFGFKEWLVTGGTISAQSVTTTFKPTADNATIQATFQSTAVYYTWGFGVYQSTGGTVESTVAAGDHVQGGTSITLTAHPATGYEVEGWYNNADCTGDKLQTGGDTYTFSISSNSVRYVKFKKSTYTITYTPATAPTGCAYTTVPSSAEFESNVTIVVTPTAGYTVSVTSSDADLSKDGNTYTFTMPAKAVAISVSATENKTAVTVSSNNTTWGTVNKDNVSVGVTTSATLKATPKTGYKFVSWALTGGARLASGVLTNAQITIKGDGSSATGTAVATFAEDLSSNWYLAGTSPMFPNGWNTGETNMMKRATGHSTENVYYFTIHVNDADIATSQSDKYQFKIRHYKKNECDDYFGWSTGDNHFWVNKTCSTDVYKGTGNDNNLYFIPTIAGDYEFKVDATNGADVKLTVTWPVYNCVYGQFNDWSKDANKLEFNGGDKASTVVNITNISESYEFLVLVNSNYLTNTASFTTPITRSTAGNVAFAAKGGSDNNAKFTPDIAGDYTFTYNKSTNKLTITYPALPTASTSATEKRMFNESELSFIESGDGTEANPYKIYTDEALTIDIAALAAQTNLTAKYQFGEDAATTDVLTKTITNPSVTETSIVVRAFYESDGVAGTAWEKTIYYQGVPTPTLHLSTSWNSHNDEAKEGSEVPADVTVYYSTTNYNGPATVTRSKDGEDPVTFMNIESGIQAQAIYNLPDQNVQRQTFVATATANGRTFTATKAISVYRLVEIIITDAHHLMDHYYMWEAGTMPTHEEAAWPGNNFVSTLGNAHIFYVKYPSYTDFVLNNGRAATEDDAAQTVDITLPDHSTCYTIGEKITTEGDDKGKYDVQVTSECPNKLYVGDIPEVSAVQGEGVIVSPQVDIDPLLDANNLTISFNYLTTTGITCDQRGRSFMVTATAGTGTYNIQVTYSIPGADPITKPVTINVTSAIMIQAKYGNLGWSDHNEIYIHYWGTDINATQKMTWKDYVGEAPNKQDRVYARIPLGTDDKINFQIYAWNMDEDWHVTKDVTNVTESGCYIITPDPKCENGCKRNINRESENCWTAYYVEIDMNNGTVYRSNTVEDLNNAVSFFAPDKDATQAKAGAVRIICNGSQTAVVDAATFDSSTVYTAKIAANGTGLTDVEYYTGDYYIRTDAAEGGWDNYKQESHKFTYFTPYKEALYDYYWVQNKKMANPGDQLNIKACVGNDINENLANMIESSNYTDGYGNITPDASTGVNLRFGYNPETNYFERSILRGSTVETNDFLNIVGNNIFNDKSCGDELNEANYSAHADWSKFGDISNWVYEKNVYVKIDGEHQDAQALLKSKAFNGTTIYQLGYKTDDLGRPTSIPTQRDILYQGTTQGTYNIRIIYDFKTNRIVSAWSPITDVTFNDATKIDADVLFVRHENQQAAQIHLSQDAAKVSSLQFAYFVLEIDGATDKTSESIYWFSVPFDCYINSIFGVEGYVTLDANGKPTAGTWGIQEYDGKTRAEKGWYIQDTQTFWRWMRKDEKLKKGHGYVLVFDRADANNKHLWSSITREEPCEGTDPDCVDGKKTVTTTILRLYFPSSESGWQMTRSGKEQWVKYEDWTCQKKDRKAQDSNWRLLGTDSYSNIMITEQAQFHRLDDDSVVTKAPNFVYIYDRSQSPYNRYAPVTSVGKNFQSFNCYMVQFSGTINWNQYTQSEQDRTGVAARRIAAENELTNAQMTLSLKKGNNTEDNTYIYMDTRATTDFDNQMDLTKITDTRANHIYSVINEVEYAGNTLPVEDQIVPITVNVNANGAYTFAMPEMTDGLEVYLMDNATNAHIDMAIDSYTVDLNKGKIADRFYLDVRVKERTTPTIIETIGTDGNPTGDRFIKVIQNDQLHIIRNGRIYNASGMELNR